MIQNPALFVPGQSAVPAAEGNVGRITQFKDSLFYDISNGHIPLAFGVDYEEVRNAGGHRYPHYPTLQPPVGKIIGYKAPMHAF